MTDRPLFGPLPDDPDAATVVAMFDARHQDWILTTAGEYQSAAVEAFREDGSNHQEMVVLEWPGRRNHTDEHLVVRLMMAPDDALGLAQLLAHTATWMLLRHGAEPS